MLRRLPNHKIDFKRWDALVQNSGNGNIYALSDYLNIISPKWEALVYGNYEAIMPLAVKRWAHLRLAYQPLWAQQWGIIGQTEDVAVSKAFAQRLQNDFHYVNLHFNEKNKALIHHFKGFEALQRRNHLLSLSPAYPDLAKNYATNTRRNIKKAQKNALQVLPNPAPRRMLQMFAQNQGVNLPQLKKKHYRQMLSIMQMAKQNGTGIFRALLNERGSMCAALFWLNNCGRLVNLLQTSNPSGKKRLAMFALTDMLIREYAGSDLLLDFEGSMNEGVARFYKGFGAKPVLYPNVRRNVLPAYARWHKK